MDDSTPNPNKESSAVKLSDATRNTIKFKKTKKALEMSQATSGGWV